MGSMKNKRRKSLAKEWANFQESHSLSDICLKQARAIGNPPKLLQERLVRADFDESLSMADRIGELHRQWQEKLAARETAIESGEMKPMSKKKKKKPAHDLEWAKAKQVCCLNMEDIRMAKELGLGPRALMKNVPNSAQPWKASVQVWIRDLYESRQQRRRSKTSSDLAAPAPATADAPQGRSQVDSHDRMIQD